MAGLHRCVHFLLHPRRRGDLHGRPFAVIFVRFATIFNGMHIVQSIMAKGVRILIQGDREGRPYKKPFPAGLPLPNSWGKNQGLAGLHRCGAFFIHRLLTLAAVLRA